MPKAYLIIDGMWGSCGKGSLAGKLATDRNPDVVICNFGPNAGHTFIGQGRKVMTQQLPTGLVAPNATLLIGPGAMIDPVLLMRELNDHPYARGRLLIHEHAAIVTAWDKVNEERLVKIGSTRKGTASAAMRKMMRVPVDGNDLPAIARDCHDLRDYIIDDAKYNDIVKSAKLIQVESAQGIELSLARGKFYPFCTGRDITPEQVLNDCAVPHRFLLETFLVMRTYPIRVGNEVRDGKQVGTSGPVYSGMDELTWEDLAKETGIEGLSERTTVTNKVRRVFRASMEQVMHAMYVAGPSTLFLNFMNYLDPRVKLGAVEGPNRLAYANEKAQEFVRVMEFLGKQTWGNIPPVMLGWGPSYNDIEDLRGR